MIYDAIVPVSCDTCEEEIQIEPNYVHHGYSGESGYYDCSQKAIEKKLKAEGWVCENEANYCCLECAEGE